MREFTGTGDPRAARRERTISAGHLQEQQSPARASDGRDGVPDMRPARVVAETKCMSYGSRASGPWMPLNA